MVPVKPFGAYVFKLKFADIEVQTRIGSLETGADRTNRFRRALLVRHGYRSVIQFQDAVGAGVCKAGKTNPEHIVLRDPAF